MNLHPITPTFVLVIKYLINHVCANRFKIKKKMKNLILAAFAIFMMGNVGFSQMSNADFRNKISIGIKSGGNYSNVYDTQGEQFNADGKFGLVAGGFISIPLGPLLGVQPEVLFSQKGFSATGSILGGNYELTRTLNYIDVPLFLVIKPAEMISFLIGPQYSYLLKQKDVFKNGTLTVEQQKEFDNENIRKNTFSVIAGFDFNLGSFVIGTRGGWNLQSNNGDGTSTTPRYRNAWYQATLGLRF